MRYYPTTLSVRPSDGCCIGTLRVCRFSYPTLFVRPYAQGSYYGTGGVCGDSARRACFWLVMTTTAWDTVIWGILGLRSPFNGFRRYRVYIGGFPRLLQGLCPILYVCCRHIDNRGLYGTFDLRLFYSRLRGLHRRVMGRIFLRGWVRHHSFCYE